MVFTTRPELHGTFGMVASTHWLASATGMAMLERGGNAFDAAVAAGLVLQVVEPHLNGPGGEVPIVFWSADREEPLVLCGQGVAPAAATIDHFRRLGLDAVPGTGLLAATVPGAFDGWMLLLRDFGTLRLAEVAEPAIGYAEAGHPVLPRVAAGIAAVQELFERDWPTSGETFLPAPRPWERFRNPALAATYRRIVEGASGGSREDEIDRARSQWYRGFVAEAIVEFMETEVLDSSGRPHRGLLAGDDLAEWEATLEAPAALEYHGHTVCKTGPWGQGPVMLQQLALLEGFELAEMHPLGAEFVHSVVECAKLAFADREAWYGDPHFAEVPLAELLAPAYADARRALVRSSASGDLRPGSPGGRGPRLPARDAAPAPVAAGIGEPTRGDTCHLDVADRFGNLVSATPSGGWLHSSPVVPGLGFPLGTRAQMFWLEDGLPNSLAPRKRPRTTLSPSLALRGGAPYLAFGTPGGDAQDQWSLIVFLRHVHHRLDLQAAIDAPVFHTNHFPSSFYPREARPREVEIETRFDRAVVGDLRERGHRVVLTDDWALGRVSAAAREPDGTLKAAANPRGMQGYAVGR